MFEVVQRTPGQPCLGASLIPAGYAEFPEFREGGTLEQVTSRLREAMESLDRYELVVSERGAVVGYACAALDEDLHVGLCLTLQWQYVLPEYRGAVGREFVRWLLRKARSSGLKHVAYSHRINQGHYAIKYRRISNG